MATPSPSTSPDRTLEAALPDEEHTVWTLRTVASTSPCSVRFAGFVGAVGALLTSLHGDVPLAASATVAALVPAAMVDVQVRRLPNRLVGFAALIGVFAVAIGSNRPFLHALLGAGLFAVPLLVMHLISPASMGFGDVKASIVLGAAIGLVDPVLALAALFVASLAASVAGLLARRRSVPFGPSLVLGAVAVLAVPALSPAV